MTTHGTDRRATATIPAGESTETCCNHRARGPDGPPEDERESGSTGRGGTPRVDCTRPLDPRWESIPAAREFVTSTLQQWGMPQLCDSVELVVSELVTNALRHGVLLDARDGTDTGTRPAGEFDESIELKLMHNGPRVVCLVSDPSNDIPVRKPLDAAATFGDPPDLDGLDEFEHLASLAEAGHGLHLVTSYCRRWGWAHLTGGGKVVWALFHPPGPPVVGT